MKIYDASSGSHLQTISGLSPMNSMAFSPDYQLVTAGYDGVIDLWDAKGGSHLKVLARENTAVMAVAFSQPRLASLSVDSTIKVWDMNSGECLKTLRSHGAKSFSIAFSQGILVSVASREGSATTVVETWNVDSGALLRSFYSKFEVRVIALSSDASQLALGIESLIKLLKFSSATFLHQLEGHRGFIGSVMFSHDSA